MGQKQLNVAPSASARIRQQFVFEELPLSPGLGGKSIFPEKAITFAMTQCWQASTGSLKRKPGDDRNCFWASSHPGLALSSVIIMLNFTWRCSEASHRSPFSGWIDLLTDITNTTVQHRVPVSLWLAGLKLKEHIIMMINKGDSTLYTLNKELFFKWG